jgi:ketosteroid isomerase-like protein
MSAENVAVARRTLAALGRAFDAYVIAIRDGKIALLEVFTSRDEALEAASRVA